MREYFRRYYRELKKREEMFIEEIETFQATETRLMRNLRDVLEIESSNMSEGNNAVERDLLHLCYDVSDDMYFSRKKQNS